MRETMSKREAMRHRRSQRQLRNRLWLGAGVALIILIAAVAVLRAVTTSAPNTNLPDVAGNLRDTNTALNVGTLIGQPAPSFTLPDANGQPYQFQPGHGRKYVLVFNMGYV